MSIPPTLFFLTYKSFGHFKFKILGFNLFMDFAIHTPINSVRKLKCKNSTLRRKEKVKLEPALEIHLRFLVPFPAV